MQKTKNNNKRSSSLKKEITSIVKSIEIQKENSQTKKWLESNVTSTATQTVTFNKVSTVGPGTGNAQRIGNKIHAKHISLRGTIILADTSNVVRVILFKWLMNDGSDAPGAAEILTETTDPQSNLVPLKPSRFKVLKDQVFHLDTAHIVRTFIWKIKLEYDLTFDPSTNTGIGQLYYLILSDSGAVPNPAYDINTQLVYVDSN